MHDELSPIQLFFKKQSNSIARRITGKKTYYDAQKFTATDEVSGKMQADIILSSGCTPESHVLEVGCGCLSAGMHLIRFLNPDRYAGIDPNEWLREVALRQPGAAEVQATRRPVFASNLEFDPSEFGRQFDFVLSHSILSHAAHWQLPLFLKNVGKCLSPAGRIFASLYLAEGNDFGNKGSKDGKDSMDQDWVYPGISFFTNATVGRAAQDVGLTATYRPDLTQSFTKIRPLEIHDWFEFRQGG